jgi:hypothetical protein
MFVPGVELGFWPGDFGFPEFADFFAPRGSIWLNARAGALFPLGHRNRMSSNQMFIGHEK